MTEQLSKNAEKAIEGLLLLDGESIQAHYEADGFFVGTSPIAKAIAQLTSFIVKVTGGHIRIFLIITSHRVLLIQSTAAWCGFQQGKNLNVISRDSLKEAGFGKETQFFCIHSRMIHLQSLTQRHTLVVKKFSDADLQNFVKDMSIFISKNIKNI